MSFYGDKSIHVQHRVRKCWTAKGGMGYYYGPAGKQFADQ
jgi:hypothetical protein